VSLNALLAAANARPHLREQLQMRHAHIPSPSPLPTANATIATFMAGSEEQGKRVVSMEVVRCSTVSVRWLLSDGKDFTGSRGIMNRFWYFKYPTLVTGHIITIATPYINLLIVTLIVSYLGRFVAVSIHLHCISPDSPSL
jgi:hypothetical protein